MDGMNDAVDRYGNALLTISYAKHPSERYFFRQIVLDDKTFQAFHNQVGTFNVAGATYANRNFNHNSFLLVFEFFFHYMDIFRLCQLFRQVYQVSFHVNFRLTLFFIFYIIKLTINFFIDWGVTMNKRNRKLLLVLTIFLVCLLAVTFLTACDNPFSKQEEEETPSQETKSAEIEQIDAAVSTLVARTFGMSGAVLGSQNTFKIGVGGNVASMSFVTKSNDLASFAVYSDKTLKKSVTGSVDLKEGDNVFYLSAKRNSANATYTLIVNRPHVHSFGDWTVSTAATCTKEGRRERTCSCGTKDVEYVAATGHKVVRHDRKAPTCTEDGHEEYVSCENCNYTTYQKIDKLGHLITRVAAVAATCTENGNVEYWHCDRCDKYYSNAEGTTEITAESIVTTKLGHDIKDVAAKAATCEEIGWNAHRACSRCDLKENYTPVPANGHDYGELISGTLATCTSTGTYAHFTCSVCEKNFDQDKNSISSLTIPKLEHSYVETSNTSPTCTEKGEIVYTCELCFATRTVTPAALGHNLQVTPALAATCTEDGHVEYYYCNKCDRYYLDENAENAVEESSVVIEKTGHSLVFVSASNNTCTDAGNVAHYFCSVCNEYFEDENAENPTTEQAVTLPVLGHDWQITDSIPSTCTENGSVDYQCSRCGETKTDISYAIGYHTYDEWEITTPAACLTAGEQRHVCTICLYEETQVIPALGHSYGEWNVITSATCTNAGSQQHVCSACSHEESQDIPALGHSYGEWSVTTPPTCTNAGSQQHVCSACSLEESQDIPALGHDFDEDYVCAVCGTIRYIELVFTLLPEETAYVVSSTLPGRMTDVVVPSSYEGKPVVSIADGAFSGLTLLEAIVIPDGVTSIGAGAFAGCTDLASVTLGKDVKSIGASAFAECEKIENVFFKGTLADWCGIAFSSTPLVSVFTSFHYDTDDKTLPAILEIPDVTTISSLAFSYRHEIKSVKFGASVPVLETDAFIGCYILEIGFATSPAETEEEMTALEQTLFASGILTHCISAYMDYVPGSQSFLHTDSNGYMLYENTNEDIKIFVGYTGAETTLTLPEGTMSVWHAALLSRTDVTEVTIPSTVTLIGDDAFAKTNADIIWTSLAEDTTATIGKYAFYQYGGTELIFPEGVTEIGEHAFDCCENLERISLPDSLQELDAGVFFGCSSLREIAVPFIVTSLSDDISSDDYSVSDIVSMPLGILFGTTEYAGSIGVTQDYTEVLSNLTQGTATFYIPASLRKVTIGRTPTQENNYRDVLTANAFYGCSFLTDVTVKSSILSIGSFAFYGCRNVNNLVFEDSSVLYYVGNYAFYDCISLTSMLITCEDVTIGEEAFTNCPISDAAIPASAITLLSKANLVNVTITGGSELPDRAFAGATNLTNVFIGAGVTTFDSQAFYNCTSLNEVTYGSSVSDWCKISFADNGTSNPLFYADRLTVAHIGSGDVVSFEPISGAVTLESTVTAIPAYTFKNSAITAITLPAGVTSIGASAFYGCTDLVTVSFAETPCLVSIGDYAFRGCTNLAKTTVQEQKATLTLPDSVVVVGSQAFRGCSELQEITLLGAQEIGEYAFYGCAKLEKVKISSAVSSIADTAFYGCSSLIYNEVDNGYYLGNDAAATDDDKYVVLMAVKNKDTDIFTVKSSTKIVFNNAFNGCDNLTGIVIPDGVLSIGDFAFASCSSLETVVLGDNVRSIGNSAFLSCGALETVTVGSALQVIGNDAFKNCDSLAYVNLSELDALYAWCGVDFKNEYSNPMTFDSAEKMLIGGADLTGLITLPAGVTVIPAFTFKNSGITGITIPQTVTAIGPYAFYGCGSLLSITFSGTSALETIGEYAFADCSALTVVALPSSVSTIGAYAFYNCVNLTRVTARGVTELKAFTFRKCSSLKEITLSTELTHIAFHTFFNCSDLADVYYNGTLEQWNNVTKDNNWDNTTGYYVVHCSNGERTK